MSPITRDLLAIFTLIVLNNLLAMTEAAFLASRRARLQQLVNEEKRGARQALALSQEPNRFLSVIQIGITLIDIMTGAIGGATLAEFVALQLEAVPRLAPYADGLGLTIVVLTITYFSIVFGELVPKRIGILNPEGIITASAGLMTWFSRLLSPVVRLLSLSTEGVLRLFSVDRTEAPPITEEELHMLIDQGTQAGIFKVSEQEMVSGVFRLGDRRIYALMTPRTEIVWLDLTDSAEEIEKKLTDSPFSRYPVCRGDLDHVVGLVKVRDILAANLKGQPIDLARLLQPAIFIPETTFAAQALEFFREHHTDMLIVIDEYGGVQGIVTVQDIVEEVVGEIEPDAPQATQRPDGSWLLDGMMAVEDFKGLFALKALPREEAYETLAGFIITQLGHIPKTGERLQWKHMTLEVVDMDGRRIDKVLVSTRKTVPVKGNSHEADDRA